MLDNNIYHNGVLLSETKISEIAKRNKIELYSYEWIRELAVELYSYEWIRELAVELYSYEWIRELTWECPTPQRGY